MKYIFSTVIVKDLVEKNRMKLLLVVTIFNLEGEGENRYRIPDFAPASKLIRVQLIKILLNY